MEGVTLATKTVVPMPQLPLGCLRIPVQQQVPGNAEITALAAEAVKANGMIHRSKLKAKHKMGQQ